MAQTMAESIAASMAQASMAQASMAQASMAQLSRLCTGCAGERVFEQFHAEPASCPDVPDGDCPEWACTSCGDALIIGVPAAPGYAGRDRAIRAA